jgi:hypothetical protein
MERNRRERVDCRINRYLRMSRTAVWVALIAIVLVGLYLLQANGMIRF